MCEKYEISKIECGKFCKQLVLPQRIMEYGFIYLVLKKQQSLSPVCNSTKFTYKCKN